jgi:hypothetical protein
MKIRSKSLGEQKLTRRALGHIIRAIEIFRFAASVFFQSGTSRFNQAFAPRPAKNGGTNGKIQIVKKEGDPTLDRNYQGAFYRAL